MTIAPKCSVIMPAYNSAAFIGEAIESVLCQTMPDWELIVVDDGSTDDTASIVQRFKDPRIHYFYQNNAGQSAAQNMGIREMRGEYASFLDSDDRFRPTALERFLKAFDKAPSACAVYGNATKIFISGESCGDPARPVFGPRPSGDVLPALLATNFITNGGVLLARADCVRKAGGFNVELRLQQGWEMCCRLAIIGNFIFIGHEPVLEYRIRIGSVARSAGGRMENHLPAIEAVYENQDIKLRFSEETLKRLRRHRKSDTYFFVGTEAVRILDWRQARKNFIKSLQFNIMNIRSMILLFFTFFRKIPRFVRRRFGVSKN